MYVQDILRSKGDSVYQISPDATLADVVETLVRFNVGSLMVCQDGLVLGIITERDILRTIAAEPRPLNELSVRDYMTTQLIVGTPHEDLSDVMGKMTSHRVRHLPIVQNGELAGMISIGDVVKMQFENLAVENHYMKVYIQQGQEVT